MIKPINVDVEKIFKEKNTFLIMAHQKPDGDAVGSAIALGLGLKQLGKNVDYYMDTNIEKRLSFFPEIESFNQDRFAGQYDAYVFVDCSSYDYARKPELLPDGPVKVVIDHHLTNVGYGDANHVENTSACAELIYRLLVRLGVVHDDQIAEALYTAISTDTGGFHYSSVTADTFDILKALYEHPNRFALLADRLHRTKGYDELKLYGKAIDSLTRYADDRLAWIVMDEATIQSYGGMVNVGDDVANIGIQLEGTAVAATVKENNPGEYKISLRSAEPYPVDVSLIADRHGGGGHMRAAGFNYAGDLADLKQELVAFLLERKAEIDACD